MAVKRPVRTVAHNAARAVCLALALAAATVTSADEITDRATALLQARDWQAAYDLLAPLESERAGEPEFDYLMGLAALETGRYTEAVFAFERVLAIEPGNALARADMARALAGLNEFDSARRELETVREADIPTEAAETIDAFLAALRARPVGTDGKSFQAYVSAAYGFDTNVAASSTAVGFNNPNLIGKQSDIFGRFAGGMSGRYPIRPNLAFIGAVNTYARLNQDKVTNPLGVEFDLDQFSINGFAGLEYLRGKNAWSASVQAEHFKSGWDGFRNLFGVTGQLRHRINDVSHVTGYVQWARLHYLNQRFRNVNRWTAGASYARLFPGPYRPEGYAGLYGGQEHNLASGRGDQGHIFFGMRLGGSVRLSSQMRAVVNFNYEHRRYRATDQVWSLLTATFNPPAQFVTRNDDRLFLRVALDWEPAKLWFVTPSYQYNLSDSSLPTTDYDRHVAMLEFRREFR